MSKERIDIQRSFSFKEKVQPKKNFKSLRFSMRSNYSNKKKDSLKSNYDISLNLDSDVKSNILKKAYFNLLYALFDPTANVIEVTYFQTKSYNRIIGTPITVGGILYSINSKTIKLK